MNVGLLMRQIQLVHMNKLLPVFYQVHSSFTVLAVDLLVCQIQLVHMTKFLLFFVLPNTFLIYRDCGHANPICTNYSSIYWPAVMK